MPMMGLRRRFFPCLVIVGASLLGGCAGAPSTLDTHSGTADSVATLALILFGIATVVFLVVVALIAAAYLRSRRLTSSDVIHTTDDRRPITLILLAGAVLPAVILFGMMLYSISIEPANALEDHSLVIEVTGHRWWWEVRYPNQNIVTANEIHLPAGQAVTVKLTSDDVIHSFWVPQLAPKLDLIPGQTNTMTLEADQSGTYRGQCAEFCGVQHAHMAFLVFADDPDTFNRWVAQEQKPAPAPDSDLVTQGQQTFLSSACVFCHTIKGTAASGTLGPDLTHLASRTTIGAGTLTNNRGNLAGWIINSQSSKPGNLMPPMDLDADQVQAILAYLETLE